MWSYLFFHNEGYQAMWISLLVAPDHWVITVTDGAYGECKFDIIVRWDRQRWEISIEKLPNFLIFKQILDRRISPIRYINDILTSV